MSHSTFPAIAKDPTIIPGVHHHCDEWCDYCLVTNRCLAFRCTAEHRRRQSLADEEPTFAASTRLSRLRGRSPRPRARRRLNSTRPSRKELNALGCVRRTPWPERRSSTLSG
jgi:hypothetical protein